MFHKLQLIAFTTLFALWTAGCPEGGINTNDNDAGPPQRDSTVDAADVEVNPCGDGVCDEAGGEDCANCERDCLGIACSPVRDITVQEFRDDHLGKIGETAIDLRTAIECQDARIPGDTFCPPDLSAWWDGTTITDGGGYLEWATPSVHNPLVFYGYGNDDASVLALAKSAWDFGFDNLYRIVGGIEAWRAEGWYQDIAYEGLVRQFYPPSAGVYVIDTMDSTHYDDCHMQDAVNLDTYTFFYGGELINNGQPLLDLAPDLQNDVLIFFCINLACVASKEAAEAAEILGYAHIYHYKEGTEDWYCPPHSGPVVGPGCAAVDCSP